MTKFKYKIIRSMRKSVALHIERNGSLIVRAPLMFPKKEIEEFVNSKEKWILSKQAEIKAFKKEHPLASVSYLGKIYKTVKNDSNVKIEGDKIFAPNRRALLGFLMDEAAKILEERVRHFAEIMKVAPRIVKLSNAQSKWGSCSSKKSVNLSWRLIFCPLPVIDYVVVHELSHLTHMDHSRTFWARVEEILPNYKIQKEWLKGNGNLLEWKVETNERV